MNKKLGCVIMASGQSKRFGSNKLLAEFDGKTLIQRILNSTESVFDKRVVLTRTQEVVALCREQKVEVIYHNYPYRNDAIKLGVDYMQEMDAIVFCPSDQPLLSRESLGLMKKEFDGSEKEILRMCTENKQGTPVLFGKAYFEDLKKLPEKKGGSYLLGKYPERIKKIKAFDENELFDVDSLEDFVNLLSVIRN